MRASVGSVYPCSILSYRHQHWDNDLKAYLQHLNRQKPVIACGDFNVAHREIDLARPKSNRRNPGFTDEERQGFSAILSSEFIDTFRHFHPDAKDQYSWWSYRANARAKNIGWRIDYVLISETLRPQLEEAFIRPAVTGSDHCPVGIKITDPGKHA